MLKAPPDQLRGDLTRRARGRKDDLALAARKLRDASGFVPGREAAAQPGQRPAELLGQVAETHLDATFESVAQPRQRFVIAERMQRHDICPSHVGLHNARDTNL